MCQRALALRVALHEAKLPFEPLRASAELSEAESKGRAIKEHLGAAFRGLTQPYLQAEVSTSFESVILEESVLIWNFPQA